MTPHVSSFGAALTHAESALASALRAAREGDMGSTSHHLQAVTGALRSLEHMGGPAATSWAREPLSAVLAAMRVSSARRGAS